MYDHVNVTVLPVTVACSPVGVDGVPASGWNRWAPIRMAPEHPLGANSPAWLAVKQLHVVVLLNCGADGTGAPDTGGAAEVGEEGVPPPQAAVATTRTRHAASDLRWVLKGDSLQVGLASHDPLASPSPGVLVRRFGTS